MYGSILLYAAAGRLHSRLQKEQSDPQICLPGPKFVLCLKMGGGRNSGRCSSMITVAQILILTTIIPIRSPLWEGGRILKKGNHTHSIVVQPHIPLL